MNIFDIITDVIFPPHCLFCGENMGMGTRPLICENCKISENAFRGKCCRCSSDFVYRDGFPHCNTCRSCRHPFDGVVSAYLYRNGIRRAVIEHKFNFEYNNAPTLAVSISEIIQRLFRGGAPDCIIPVPSGRKRLRDRGYDPLLEIAEEVSANTDLPLLPGVLIKKKDIPQQSTLSVRQRLRNVRGCFGITDKSLVKNKRIILLDDVYTTGATTRECAKVLRRAGAAYIIIATVAISETFRR